jgi:hypothetical protein
LHDFASNGQTIDMVAGLNRRPCGLCVQPISSQPRWLDQVSPTWKRKKERQLGHQTTKLNQIGHVATRAPPKKG